MTFHPKLQALFSKKELDFLLSSSTIYQASSKEDEIDYMYFSRNDGFMAEIRIDTEEDDEVYIYDLNSDSHESTFISKTTLLASLTSSTAKEITLITVD
ncbi:MAG: hypothetical protein DRQ78_13450 [Epsilonproteobacteria bacterium]|nr:MAG: hypothetical protein DRQ78_13450 [Campylobacterota bacterium]